MPNIKGNSCISTLFYSGVAELPPQLRAWVQDHSGTRPSLRRWRTSRHCLENRFPKLNDSSTKKDSAHPKDNESTNDSPLLVPFSGWEGSGLHVQFSLVFIALFSVGFCFVLVPQVLVFIRFLFESGLFITTS